MARASGTTGASITTSPTAIFTAGDEADGNACTSFFVRCQSGSSNPVAVSVPQLHGEAYVLIPAGESMVFRRGTEKGDAKINSVLAKGVGGTANVDYCVLADGA